MNRGSLFARSFLFDAFVVVAALSAALEIALRDDPARAPRSTFWFALPAVTLAVLTLLARRRLPFAAPAAFWLAGAAISFVDGRLLVFANGAFVAGIGAAALLGNLRDPLSARVGLAITVGAAATIAYNDPNRGAGEIVFIPLLFAIGWLGGYAVQTRAGQAEAAEARAQAAERERETAARLAVAEERARIARELHDVVAHAVSVMVLQVGAVRHRLPAGLTDDRDALQDVERAGRTALAEMRRLLGAMRREDEDAALGPQPGLESVAALVEDVGRAGLPVRLRVEGDPHPLPRGLDLSAYRIVQEGLTNALKHARATHVDVTVRYGGDALRIEVLDDGAGGAASDGLGHGLIGVRERVKLYGGRMSAGRTAGGGFLLSTELPLGTEAGR